MLVDHPKFFLLFLKNDIIISFIWRLKEGVIKLPEMAFSSNKSLGSVKKAWNGLKKKRFLGFTTGAWSCEGRQKRAPQPWETAIRPPSRAPRLAPGAAVPAHNSTIRSPVCTPAEGRQKERLERRRYVGQEVKAPGLLVWIASSLWGCWSFENGHMHGFSGRFLWKIEIGCSGGGVDIFVLGSKGPKKGQWHSREARIIF